MARLLQLSQAPYGPSGETLLNYSEPSNGSAFVVDGKPLVLFIGAEYCPFCAIQRWSLVLALMRFGNFSNLIYMTSNPAEGDLATFSFSQVSYSSDYIAFQAFEVLDRNYEPLQSVPSNYSAIWSQHGSDFPFMDFGNEYIVPTSMLRYGLLQNESWSGVMSSIAAGLPLGVEIRESANAITTLICRITGGQPDSVCGSSPIGQSGTIDADALSASFLSVLCLLPVSQPAPRHSRDREDRTQQRLKQGMTPLFSHG